MSIVENIRAWLKSDPQARQKLIFFLVAGLIISSLLGIIWWFNFGIARNPGDNNQSSNSVSSAIQSAPNVDGFGEASRVEKVNSTTLGITKTLFIEGEKSVFFDQDARLILNNLNVADSPQFLPRSIYLLANNNLIINQSQSTTLVQNNQFIDYESGISSVVPVNNGFIFLQKTATNFNLKFAQDIELSNGVIQLAELKTTIQPTLAELRLINNEINLITYSNDIRTGATDIWLYDNGNLNKIQTISNLQSILFGKNRILYTTSRNVNQKLTYFSNQIDFSNKPGGEVSEINLNNQLLDNQILGYIWADRCDFEGSDELICLIKQNGASIDSFADTDQIVVINLKNITFELPYLGLLISAGAVHAKNNNIYVVGQENSVLYRLK